MESASGVGSAVQQLAPLVLRLEENIHPALFKPAWLGTEPSTSEGWLVLSDASESDATVPAEVKLVLTPLPAREGVQIRAQLRVRSLGPRQPWEVPGR